MFIRRTQTRTRATGEPYYTYRLAETARVKGAVKQTTLLNLGSHFSLPKEEWAELCLRIDALWRGRSALLHVPLSEVAEDLAQRYAAQLIARHAAPVAPAAEAARPPAADEIGRYQDVDLDTLELVRPRSVGVEQAALSVMRQCGFEEILTELGFNRRQVAAAVGTVVGRMAKPGSELATHAWLQQRSGLGELIDFDFEGMDLNRLYRISDALYLHRDALQDRLFSNAMAQFGFSETIALYDLTNTYFEGMATANPKAARGRSKEKRSDCPLVTLALVLDGSGFPRRSQVFSGNVSEAKTLETMLTDLGAPKGATVVMDAGIATQANLDWLKAQGYHYVVVSRERKRAFEPEGATEVQTAKDATIKTHRVVDAKTGEVRLYCHSPQREEKDHAIDEVKANEFEAALQRMVEGLSRRKNKPETVANLSERIGRAKERYARAAQHYSVTVTPDDSGLHAATLTWTKQLIEGRAAAHPGVYCLRTTRTELDNAALWRTYSLLTNLESVFRSLKTDLGLRPVYHQVAQRVEGHLFISVLAYHFVHAIRLQLKAKGIDDAWDTVRETLAGQQRITVTIQRRDGHTVHVRKATRPEPRQQKICEILKVPLNPGGTHRTLV